MADRDMMAYLLGELPEEEQVRLEGEYFSNEEAFEQLLAAEEELMDAYVRGEIEGPRRERFEKHFLASPRRRERLKFAAATAGYAAAAPAANPERMLRVGPQPRYWAWRLAAVAAMALIALGGFWLILENSRLKTQVAELRARPPQVRGVPGLLEQIGRERARADRLAAELAHERNQREVAERQRPGPLVSFALLPIAVRGSGASRLVIPQGTRTVEFRLSIGEEPDYTKLRAQLRTADGDEVWSADVSKPSGRSVVLRLRSELLGANDYILRLSAISAGGQTEEVAAYSFNVSKK